MPWYLQTVDPVFVAELKAKVEAKANRAIAAFTALAVRVCETEDREAERARLVHKIAKFCGKYLKQKGDGDAGADPEALSILSCVLLFPPSIQPILLSRKTISGGGYTYSAVRIEDWLNHVEYRDIVSIKRQV